MWRRHLKLETAHHRKNRLRREFELSLEQIALPLCLASNNMMSSAAMVTQGSMIERLKASGRRVAEFRL